MYDIILIGIGFVAVHLFKMMRLYLVLMEHRIPFWEFLLLYFRTTLVNLIIPFKLGEIYRIEEISRKTRVWQVGVLSVVVDRFFDTLALFVLLLPTELILGHSVSKTTGFFYVVLLLAALIYLAIPGSFAYLNQYLIMRKSSARTMTALKGLDVIKKWYDFTRNLIKGRSMLILFASFLGWLSEIGTLCLIESFMGNGFGPADFAIYISSVFQAGENQLKTVYTQIGIWALAIGTVIGYLVFAMCRLAESAEKKAAWQKQQNSRM